MVTCLLDKWVWFGNSENTPDSAYPRQVALGKLPPWPLDQPKPL